MFGMKLYSKKPKISLAPVDKYCIMKAQENDRTKEKKMTYFIQIFDAWDCEIDFIGPFNTENEAYEAGWSKWEGDETAYGSRIIKRLPAFSH
jgi:hypothetical protein